MADPALERTRTLLDDVYRRESRRVFATLVRLLRDFDLAEEALHEAFASALEHWTRDGVPANPRAWLVSAGRFKAIDALRRRTRFQASQRELYRRNPDVIDPAGTDPDQEIEDDRLRLIFTCCHPAIAHATQVALTLREVCELTTEEIARAFLASPATIAQRIVRGKAKIRDAGIPFEIPDRQQLPERLDAVLSIVYLVFNEGYSASSGDNLTRSELSGEAIRLGRLLLELHPDPEVRGLVALMLLQESRRFARTDAEGDLVLLEDQDRSLWDRDLIEEGQALVAEAFAAPAVGLYTLQAAIAAVHADARSADGTDWAQIAGLYDLLLEATASPVVELNRAVSIAMRDGPEAGLALIDAILNRGDLSDFHLAHAARADLCRRLGQKKNALSSYERALSLAKQDPEVRFLKKRIAELS